MIIAALSPVESWVLFGACVAFGVVVYLAIAVGLERRDAWIGELMRSANRTWTDPADPQLRIFGGIYDHEGRGDFE